MIWGIVVICLLVTAAVIGAYKSGKKSSSADNANKKVSVINEAKKIRDSLNDPDERSRVRAKYTRSE